MSKTIRPTYPIELSIGLLFLIFFLSCFLSYHIFDIHSNKNGEDIYYAMSLVGVAVIIMVLIVWEEFLFPINIKPVKGGMIFRNHRSKLRIQVFFYCFIPTIFTFVYIKYAVHPISFGIYAAVCIGFPVVEKLISGINNYNDFLLLTDTKIEFKNNAKIGTIEISNIIEILIIRDERKVLQKIQLILLQNNIVTVDIDEMELYDFYDTILGFITNHYRHLVNEKK